MIKIAFVYVSNAAIVIGFGIIRVQSYRFGAVLDRMIKIAFATISNAAIVIDFGKILIQFYGLVVILYGLFGFSLLLCFEATAGIFFGIEDLVGSINPMGVSKADKIRKERFFIDVVYFSQSLPYLIFIF